MLDWIWASRLLIEVKIAMKMIPTNLSFGDEITVNLATQDGKEDGEILVFQPRSIQGTFLYTV